ncbi:MAG: signal peptidase I [Lachnospiraceae bacterium]|nr:signal peptidase I [Lachnospiraceae bacterium]
MSELKKLPTRDGSKDRRDLVRFTIYLLFVMAVSYSLVHFVVSRTVVSGHSMETTLSDGDNLVVDKVTYRFTDPKRFDVIIFPYLYKKNTYYIKRIIGLPGETVQITGDGRVRINGSVLEDDYGREKIRDPGEAAVAITLKDDEYFVLGDNRNSSEDSRFADVGRIKRNQILGRALWRFYPFTKIGRIDKK